MNRHVHVAAWNLWNPNAAVKWGLLFSPALGAWLHATNWREIGEPRLARANMIWVWVTVAFLVLNAGTILVHLPRSVDAATRGLAILIWAGWYWTVGQTQVKYVNDYGSDYVRKGWARPLLTALLALAVYVVACATLVYATLPSFPKSREPAALAAWVEPHILTKWHENPKLQDATIQNVVLERKDAGTYSGIVEATFSGKPERLGLELKVSDEGFSWKVKTLPDAAGKPDGK